MASARHLVPMEIYQDPMPPYDESAYSAASMQAHMYPPQHHHAPALQPVPHYIQNRSAVFPPQLPNQPNFAPLKSHSTSTSPVMEMQGQPAFNAVYLGPPQMTGYVSGSPVKKSMQPQTRAPQYAAYYQPASQKPQKALFNTFPTARPVMEKENMYHHGIYEPHIPHFAPPYPQPPPQILGKRPAESDIMSSASRDRNAKRQRPEEEEQPLILPEPEDMPVLRDDGGKPPYSYAQLIGMAILRAPNRRLTLSQIYKWISDTFSWYRDAEPGWMNSIRHNLSLNKAFVKKERPKDDPGKGNYWAIEEGMERQFLKDKSAGRRPTGDSSFMAPLSTEAPQQPTAQNLETFALPPKAGRTIDSSRFPAAETDSSSDATLPDDNKEEDGRMPPPARVVPSSPPRATFDSSPPVHISKVGTTPTSAPKQLPRKATMDSFKDSGFYSSIESSVSRPAHGGMITVENDREDLRSSALRGRGSGRAEEELARIRGSSYDPSPTRVKSAMGHRQTKEPAPPSSPLRTFDTIGFPPLTPALKLKPTPQAQPPSTVSPNTHLRRHRETIRELVGTPSQNLPTYNADELHWTPAFSLQQHDSDYSGSTPRFEPGSAYTPGSASFSSTYSLLWNDDMSCGGGNIGSNAPTPLRRASDGKLATETDAKYDESFDVFFARGSPIKSSFKRPLIQRPASAAPPSTAKALASITGSMPPPPRNPGLASPFRSGTRGGFGGHVRSISRGSRDFGPAFVNSPLRKSETAPGSDEPAPPATPVRKSGLSSGLTVNSPGDSLSIWDAYLAGLEDDEDEGLGFHMEESKDVEGLDLAKGFSSIGAGLAAQAATTQLAEPVNFVAPPPPPPVQKSEASKRPNFMRRVTSQL